MVVNDKTQQNSTKLNKTKQASFCIYSPRNVFLWLSTDKKQNSESNKSGVLIQSGKIPIKARKWRNSEQTINRTIANMANLRIENSTFRKGSFNSIILTKLWNMNLTKMWKRAQRHCQSIQIRGIFYTWSWSQQTYTPCLTVKDFSHPLCSYL